MQRFTTYLALSPCVLCGGNDGTLVATTDRHGAPMQVTCCRGCGLTYMDPIPSQEDLAHFYAEHYRHQYKQTVTPRSKHIYRAGRVAIDRFRNVAMLTQPPARVLECGAGGGEFAHLLTSRGYDYRGIEPNDGYREYAKAEYGVDLRAGTLDDAQFADDEFDLIVMYHVLEHLRDPRDGLTRVARWLRPGGHLHIEVPNALTEVSSPSNLYHRAHLYYFAAQPLAVLAASAGLTAVLADGGPCQANLTAIFRKTDAAAEAQAAPETHDDVVHANRQRTLSRYLCSGRTLAQLPERLRQRSVERQVENRGERGRFILDALYNAEAPWLGHGALQAAPETMPLRT